MNLTLYSTANFSILSLLKKKCGGRLNLLCTLKHTTLLTEAVVPRAWIFGKQALAFLQNEGQGQRKHPKR